MLKTQDQGIPVVGKGYFWANESPTFYVGDYLFTPFSGKTLFQTGKITKLHEKKGKKGKRVIFQFWPPKI